MCVIAVIRILRSSFLSSFVNASIFNIDTKALILNDPARTLSNSSSDRLAVPPIPKDRLELNFTRSSGPGGQNVNKVSTQVELRFVVSNADWMSEALRRRVAEVHAHRINKKGELILISHEQRTQEANLRRALEKLKDLLDEAAVLPKDRIATEVPERAKESRLDEKRYRSKIKAERRRTEWE